MSFGVVNGPFKVYKFTPKAIDAEVMKRALFDAVGFDAFLIESKMRGIGTIIKLLRKVNQLMPLRQL